METNKPSKQPQEPRVEYIVVDEGESSALDEVFNMLFELLDKKQSEK